MRRDRFWCTRCECRIRFDDLVVDEWFGDRFVRTIHEECVPRPWAE